MGGVYYFLELQNMQYLNTIMYNNSWKGNKETILAFSSRSGECCNLTCKTFTLAYILAHSNRICGNLNLHECVKLCRKKMLLIHFYKYRGRFYTPFFWEILKGSATDYSQWSPTLTTYPLSSQLRLTCTHNSLLCWVYSLQLQALLAPGLLSTKDRFLCKCVHTCCSVHPFLHPPHC